MSVEAKVPVDISAAVRRFERFTGVKQNGLREDQRGSYYPHESGRFFRKRKPAVIDPKKATLIATITYKPDEGKIIIQRVDEPLIGA